MSLEQEAGFTAHSDLDSLKIIDHFEKSAILLTLELQIIIFNRTLQKLRPSLQADKAFFNSLPLYTQKRSKKLFDLKHWLQTNLPATQSVRFNQQLWLQDETNQNLIPVIVDMHPITLGKRPYLLVTIADNSLQREFFAHQKLMESSYNAQFITNPRGLICYPNNTFLAYSGLDKDQLAKMTYIEWLKQQVTFKVPFDNVMSSLLEDQFWAGYVKIHPNHETSFHAILNISMLVDELNNIEHFTGLIYDLTDLQLAQSEISHLAHYDQLTGLANRNQLNREIEQILDNHHRKATFHALFSVGIDNFKIINDTFGHKIGDQLLVQITNRIRETLGKRVLVARLDGSNFAVLQDSKFDDYQLALEEIWQTAELLLKCIEGKYSLNEHSIHSSASVGACLFPFEGSENYAADQLTSFADMAKDKARKDGGNQAYLFEKSLIENAQSRLQLIEALNHSKLDDEFQICFQAQLNRSQKVVAAETLIRWHHPELGTVPPSKFIPVAEEGRQIIKIGLWVLHKTFLQLKAWNKILPKFRVSVNISPVQFHEQNFVEMIIGLIKFTQVKPSNVTLELTEGVLIKNASKALHKIQHLVTLGFEVSIDDFGTGYSSLSYLQKLPIHELKIDQSFIKHLIEDSNEEAIVDSIIHLAQSKKLKLVAEGVETEHQANYLIQKAPDILLQGFFFSRPMAAEDFEEKYIRR